MAERTTCAVIGGGPAGMVLGLLLARAGIEVTVLEKSVLHRAVLMPILRGERQGPPTPVRLLLERFPPASFVPAHLIGVGLRPEHAPAFARRPAARLRHP